MSATRYTLVLWHTRAAKCARYGERCLVQLQAENIGRRAEVANARCAWAKARCCYMLCRPLRTARSARHSYAWRQRVHGALCCRRSPGIYTPQQTSPPAVMPVRMSRARPARRTAGRDVSRHPASRWSAAYEARWCATVAARTKSYVVVTGCRNHGGDGGSTASHRSKGSIDGNQNDAAKRRRKYMSHAEVPHTRHNSIVRMFAGEEMPEWLRGAGRFAAEWWRQHSAPAAYMIRGFPAPARERHLLLSADAIESPGVILSSMLVTRGEKRVTTGGSRSVVTKYSHTARLPRRHGRCRAGDGACYTTSPLRTRIRRSLSVCEKCHT